MKKILLILFFLSVCRSGYSQCKLSVTIQASNTAICSGSPVVLTAKVTDGSAGTTYVWNTGETTQAISTNKPGLYTLTVNDGVCQATANVTLTAASTPEQPTVAKNVDIACPGTSVTLRATGPGGTYYWYNKDGFMGTGADISSGPIFVKSEFWVETIVNGCPSLRTLVTVYPIAGPNGFGASTCRGGAVTLTATGAGDYYWYANAAATPGTEVGTGSKFTVPILNETTTYYVIGVTNGCRSVAVQVIARVNDEPPAPSYNAPPVCAGNYTILQAFSTMPNATFKWYRDAAASQLLIASSEYTTEILNASVIYYVRAISPEGCEGPLTVVPVAVNSIPGQPNFISSPICAGNTATVNINNPSGTYNWYSSANSPVLLASGSSYTTPVLMQNTTYYVESISSTNCTSGTRWPVTVTVHPAPVAPIFNNGPYEVCEGGTITITPLGPGGTYKWYASANATTPIFSGSGGYTISGLAATTNYFVEVLSADSCASSTRTQVRVIVNSRPLQPTVTGSTTICSGDGAVLTAGSSSGATFEWFDQVGGAAIATGSTFTSPALTNNKTYYVQASNSVCSSLLTTVNITVNPLPIAPATNNITVCAGTTPTLTASASGPGTIRWFNTASGGSPVASGNSYTLPSPIAATTTYYAALDNGTCLSNRSPLVVKVTSTTNQFQYSSGTFCQGSANPRPQINVPGGTFSGPAGLVIDATTGEINLAASILGSYTVTYSNSCAISTNQIAIVVSPDPAFSYSASNYCQGSATDRAPIFTNPTTGTAGVFSATPAGLRFTNINSGIIDVSNSAPGTYTVINTIDAAGGCPTVVSSPVTVTIDPRVIVNAGPNQNVALNTPVQLAGSVTGGATTGTWTGGAGAFNNASNLNAIYTPAAGESSATLTLTSANPGTTCGPVSRSVTITFSPKPAPPTIVPVTQPVCAGSATTLSVQPPYTGIYRWYTDSLGGVSVFQGANYNVPSIAASATFFVENIVGGLASDRARMRVIVTALPAAPAVVNQIDSVCLGNTITLAVSNPKPTSTYRWYDSPTSLTVQATGPTFTPPVPGTNVSYYVAEEVNTCPGLRTRIDVFIKPVPAVTNSPNPEAICSGTLLNYDLTANLPGTNFIWSRAFNPGIQNPAVSDTTIKISETLINITNNNQIVDYIIRPVLNGCVGAPFVHRVTVYPTARLTSAALDTVCSGFALNYEIKYNTPAQFTWTRAAINGNPVISTPQASSFIREALENKTKAPFTATYLINYKTPGCAGGVDSFKVVVYPRVVINSKKVDTLCGGVAQNYKITSDIPGAMYTWSRPFNPSFSNPQVDNRQSDTIDEPLNNITGTLQAVEYYITTIDGGCQPEVFSYIVFVKPQPPTPTVTYVPVCVGESLRLFPGVKVSGAKFSWRGPNGFTSTQEEPVIPNVTTANSGTYDLTIIVDNCSSVTGSKVVEVTEKARVDAGPADSTVCRTATQIPVHGRITSGSGTTIWSTAGKGTFQSPINQLDNVYTPAPEDVLAGSVRLILKSTNVALCSDSDAIVIKFDKVPASDAGGDTLVCEQVNSISLHGRLLIPVSGTWSTSGTGTFSFNPQSASGASPEYRPSPADIAARSVKLTLTANTTDDCYIPANDMTISFVPPATVNAGGLRYVLENKTITLNPTVSDENVTYNWTLPDGSPATGLTNSTSKNPTVTGITDITYRLTVTDSRGCISFSDAVVKVATEVVAPNTFTPNNDGVNDIWEIKGLVAYEDAVIDIFNRYGQKVFTSIGYSKPWDGTQNGKPVPVGTYYYIINTNVFGMKYTGYVAVIR